MKVKISNTIILEKKLMFQFNSWFSLSLNLRLGFFFSCFYNTLPNPILNFITKS